MRHWRKEKAVWSTEKGSELFPCSPVMERSAASTATEVRPGQQGREEASAHRPRLPELLFQPGSELTKKTGGALWGPGPLRGLLSGLRRLTVHSSPTYPHSTGTLWAFPAILPAAKWDKILYFEARPHIRDYKGGLGSQQGFPRSSK